jgi:GNAT superfamily N-acetyltransferase
MGATSGPRIRAARLPDDLAEVERLWLAYLTWGNDEMEALHGFRLPVEEAVAHDLATIERYQSPDGRILLGVDADQAIGIGCLQRIGPGTGEIKRMYVEPARRGVGTGSAILDGLIDAARSAGYARIRLDSPDFMTSAHGLYRSRGFLETGPYAESEIPERFRDHWVFMERSLES